MQPLQLTLQGFRGIRDGLGRDELTLDFERLAEDAQLIAIAGPNGCGKTTVMDNLTPYMTLPSRASQAGSGGFTYYDHVCLPESIKDLTWAHAGRSYRSQVVIRAGTRRKTEAYLHVLNASGTWEPLRTEEGTLSDGRVETYNRCVEVVCGSKDTFLTSVFAAQGKRQLNSYRNAEIKALLADLLNQEAILGLGTRANEVARMLKLGLCNLRREQEAMDVELRQWDARRAAGQGALARVAEATLCRQAAQQALLTHQTQVARLRAERELAQATEARRQQWAAERQALLAGETQAMQRLMEREQAEAQRLERLQQRIDQRQRERVELQARWARTRREADATLRELPQVCRAERRQALASKVQAQRRERLRVCQERLNARVAAESQVAMWGERLKLIEREAGQAVLRVEVLRQRCGLTKGVPCVGTDLQSSCKLLEDARQAQALVPDASAQVERLARDQASAREELQQAQALCASLAAADAQRAHAERRVVVATDRVQRMALLAARRLACDQAQASLVMLDQEIAARGTDGGAESPQEQLERQQIAQAVQGIANEREALSQQTRAASDRLEQSLGALPPRFNDGELKVAEAQVTQALRVLESADQTLQESHQAVESLQTLNRQATALGTRRNQWAQRVAHVENELGNWALLGRCMSHDGLIALAIDDAGPALSALANDLLMRSYGPRFTVAIHTLVDTAKGDAREGFDIVVHDGTHGEAKSLALMSGGERTWVEACLTRAIALYLSQHTGRRYTTLFSDEADGALDPERKRMFMAMKRAVLELGGYEREYFVSQSPELTAMADAVIDLTVMA